MQKKENKKMKKAVENAVLPEWAQSANEIDKNASTIWNETAGAAAGVTISVP